MALGNPFNARPSDQDPPTIADIAGDNRWSQLADQYWRKPLPPARKVKTDILKGEIWDPLEKEGFDYKSLLLLENLQLLENYLWPGFTEDSSNHHVLLIVLLVAVKNRQSLPIWDTIGSNSESFSSLFRRVLSLILDDTLTILVRTHLLSFLISAFQSLDNGAVRKECAPLVSISLWHNLRNDAARETRFEQHGQLRKAWRAAAKRYDAADQTMQARIQFDRAWLYSMMLDFVHKIYEPIGSRVVAYCERFLEFLVDLESQLPTRRYVNALIQDLNLLPLIRLSVIFNTEENGLFRDLFTLLRHFVNFPIDDHSGTPLSQSEFFENRCKRLARLQRTALRDFKAKLTILALSNYGAIDKRSDLEGHLEQLEDQELADLARALGFRVDYPSAANVTVNRDLLMEILVSAHEKRKTFQEVVRDLSVMPTETDLYEPTLLRNEFYTGSQPLALPKLNLQYLTVGDFLWRCFILYRCESFFEIRKDMEDTIKRMQPRASGPVGTVQFDGFSRMALPIAKPSVIEAAPPKVGLDVPAYVRAEIALDVSKLGDSVRKEWDTLRPEDVVYLLAIGSHDSTSHLTNGHSEARQAGPLYLRTAEVVQLLDENGRIIRNPSSDQIKEITQRPRLRRLVVHIDSSAYHRDQIQKSNDNVDIYESINVLVRRKGRENNFKRVLQSIQSLTLSEIPMPNWLQEVFLGYGDPAGATYTRLSNRLKTVDFRDTFLDWQHLVECLPGKTIEPDTSQNASFGPPYVLETLSESTVLAARPSKKRRRGEREPSQPPTEVIKVSSYQPPNNGPYPVDAPKLNSIRFTPTQIDAIVSGTQPGLTVIVGPPGTGKTDVATQIINNIYHDFPSQRTLLIAHSNQALNQLFQKIINLDIDERHLLRLGHGEEDLDTSVSYGKYGRVESFLDNRARYLAEVDRLAANLGAPGAHGNSCETASYFNSVYVRPAWTKFWDAAKQSNLTSEKAILIFPFHFYFQDTPSPLFPVDFTKEQLLDVAIGCQRHIDRIFQELEDIRPFEILRNARDKANYLLIKEARIVAMTSTHAAMRRKEIADLGFSYDNIVMEEAAQITEIENFIPLALQNPKAGELPLQRVVLCGDHLQNSPVIQNLAFRQYANLEQSLFLRLVRLGVPVVNLDQQGRARSSIAELYRWRYQKLGDLPNVQTSPEFIQANAGFLYDYQFINVPDYKGKGEIEPTAHFIQNLGEAEYAVAIYQYMRLLGYPAAKISILTTYAGQRSLVRDVLSHRCARNRLFGLPRIVTTVDKYQGEQNDYVILSLTRTNRVGYLRDIRRLTVALSRARLGLYVLGRREVFEMCYELKTAFDILLKRPDKLMLVTGEVHPTSRELNYAVEATEMAGVEHLGQYVYEMTQAKVNQLKEDSSGVVELAAVTETEMQEAYTIGDVDDEEAGVKPEDLED